MVIQLKGHFKWANGVMQELYGLNTSLKEERKESCHFGAIKGKQYIDLTFCFKSWKIKQNIFNK